MCSSGCPTQDHASFGECLRSKNLNVSNLAAKAYHKHNDTEVEAYRAARLQGIQPDTNRRADVDRAVKISNETGVAYRADR